MKLNVCTTHGGVELLCIRATRKDGSNAKPRDACNVGQATKGCMRTYFFHDLRAIAPVHLK
jgi:hypothetical protein